MTKGAQWLSGRELDSRPRGRRLKLNRHHSAVVSLARHIYPSLVQVQPRKTCPCLTLRLLMGRKESNQTNKKGMTNHVNLLKIKLDMSYKSFVLFDLILYVPSTIFQDHNSVTLVTLEPAALQSQVWHSTTEPLPSLYESFENRA